MRHSGYATVGIVLIFLGFIFGNLIQVVLPDEFIFTQLLGGLGISFIASWVMGKCATWLVDTLTRLKN